MRFGMFPVLTAAIAALFILTAYSPAEEITRLPNGISTDQVYDRSFIVRFNGGVRSASALEPYRGVSRVSDSFFGPFGWGMTVVKVEPGVDMSKIYETLAADPLVKDVWPNVIRTTSQVRTPSAYYPNDPRYLNRRDPTVLTPDRQYYLELVGAPDAWEKTTGSESVIIAIIDTGVDIFHEDLQTQFWVNTGDVPNDEIDNDGNGFIDDVYGYDFYLNRGLPRDDEPTTTYHGTSTAGIAGAAGGNNVGIMGAAGGKGIQGERGARLMILRVGTDFTISLSAEIAALSYAVQMGAHIVNMSFGGEPGGNAESDAVKAAWNAGLIIVAAGGNEGAGAHGGKIDWPAAIPEAIAVGSTTIFPDRYPPGNQPRIEESWADYSKFGPEIELVAPGTALLTTKGLNSYTGAGAQSFTGTSASSPMVAGLAALIKSANPDLTNTEVRTLMQETSIDMGLAGRDEYYGYGRVDFGAALALAGRRVAGDANGDGVVNDLDVSAIQSRFGVQIGGQNYSAKADTNRDGIIDELDLFAVGSNFGLTVDS